MKLILISALAALATACSAPGAPALPAHEVNVANADFLISQLTAGTWTASPKGLAPAISPEKRSALITAIEKTSGCKVTDSDLSRQGRQLDAQVDCGNRLRN